MVWVRHVLPTPDTLLGFVSRVYFNPRDSTVLSYSKCRRSYKARGTCLTNCWLLIFWPKFNLVPNFGDFGPRLSLTFYIMPRWFVRSTLLFLRGVVFIQFTCEVSILTILWLDTGCHCMFVIFLTLASMYIFLLRRAHYYAILGRSYYLGRGPILRTGPIT